MAKILKKEKLSATVWRYRLDAPRIAKKRQAGQFVIVRACSTGERIPLTIAHAEPREGWIEIIFQAVGKSTLQLAALSVGDEVRDLAGPLGKPTHIDKFGKCLCIGGGVGIAPLFPIICALHAAGNDVSVILGARTAELLMLEDEIKNNSNRMLIATDDGSKGTKGFVSDVFKSLLSQGERFDLAVVIGPAIMMKVTATQTVAAGIKTLVSLNPIMIDGTGMCGGCRVSVGGQTKFACVDGPEFDASYIDWDEMIKRLGTYKTFETQAKEKHSCKMVGQQ
ncbi:MAG TPA: sulfide/dihydroorotate dehydrogenase-like FAD/NAD-binding protein [Chitinivibrionales bacterium]